MKGKHLKRYSADFRRKALARMERCDSVRALAKELGVSRAALYAWKREATRRNELTLNPNTPVADWRLADAEAKMVLLEREAAFRTLQDGHYKSGRLSEHGLEDGTPRTLKSKPKRRRNARGGGIPG